MMGRQSRQTAMVFVDMETLIPENHLLWKNAISISRFIILLRRLWIAINFCFCQQVHDGQYLPLFTVPALFSPAPSEDF